MINSNRTYVIPYFRYFEFFLVWGLAVYYVLLRNDLEVMGQRSLFETKKVKVALWSFSTLRLFGLLYSYPQQFPAFISRGATHHTEARDLYQRRRELLPRNFASRSVIYENPLGSFTCRKAGTWDILEGILRIFRTPEKSNGFGRV